MLRVAIGGESCEVGSEESAGREGRPQVGISTAMRGPDLLAAVVAGSRRVRTATNARVGAFLFCAAVCTPPGRPSKLPSSTSATRAETINEEACPMKTNRSRSADATIDPFLSELRQAQEAGRQRAGRGPAPRLRSPGRG